MQSHAGQKRFQIFVEKREKCKKNLLVTTHTVTSRYQRWGKSYRESLTLLPSEKAPPWRISSTQCKRLGVQNCWGQSNGFCFLTLNPYVCPFFDHQRYCPVHLFSSWFPCSAIILLLSILVHCLCMKTQKRWRHWHSLPRADQLWSPNGEKNISSGVVFTIYSIFSSSLFMSTFVIFPPIFSRVGDEFSRKPYALAVQQGSPLKDQFNDA